MAMVETKDVRRGPGRPQRVDECWIELASKRPLLTKATERELLEAVALGRWSDATEAEAAAAKTARDVLIESNVRLVISMAGKLRCRTVGIDDLIAEGCAGLAEAVDNFDLKHKSRFTTYAIWWIRRRFNVLLAEMSGPTRLPMHVWRACSPNYGEKLVVNAEHVEAAKRTRCVVRLHMPEGDEMHVNVIDRRPAPGDDVAAEDDLSKLKTSLDMLDSRTRDVVERRFGLDGRGGETLSTVAYWHGVSRERVRQIEDKALATLRAEWD